MKHHIFQFARYGVVGLLNLLLSLGVFNALMYISGVSTGPWVTVFSAVTFAIVIVHAFVWNKFFVFKARTPGQLKRESRTFFIVTGCVALLNVGIVSLLVNGIGAPAGVSAPLWANIAVLVTIPVSVLGNFTGYKFLVFAQPKEII